MRYSVKKTFVIAYAHRLLNYNGRCENLHGHNAKIEIIVEADKLDNQDMVIDFIKLNQVVKKWLDENLDHKVILSESDPLVRVLKDHNQEVFTVKENPTAEILAKLILKEIKKHGINAKIVRFWETETSMAEIKEEGYG